MRTNNKYPTIPGRRRRTVSIVGAVLGCALVLSCADPLKGKSPYWHNGYVYGTQGYAFFSQGSLDGALTSYRKALTEARRFDIPGQTAQYTFNIGRCFFELGGYDSALVYFQSAYSEFGFCGDDPASRRSAAFIALAFSDSGLADSAMAWYKRAAARKIDKKDRPFMVFLHGRLLWNRDHGREALTYFEEAFKVYKKLRAYQGMAQTCRYQAEIYRAFGEYADAVKCVEEALSWNDKSDQRFDRFPTLLLAASLSACADNSARARWYYERARQCACAGMRIPPLQEILECGISAR
ncbi:MAG TPA: tetratricopeptide repeat protein [Chitinivibrionales bacterium]